MMNLSRRTATLSSNIVSNFSRMAHTGTVRMFSEQRGYGFIEADSAEQQIFFHHSAIQMPGFKKLSPGTKVQYETTEDARGVRAITVLDVNGNPFPAAPRPSFRDNDFDD